MPFADYMQHVLYAPGLGYYAAGARKLGPSGDFVTAPEMTPLFGQALATPVAAIHQATGTRQPCSSSAQAPARSRASSSMRCPRSGIASSR